MSALSTAPHMEARYAMICNVLARENPQSVRQVFYRCIADDQPAAVPKTQNGYNQVQKALLALRRADEVPWDWVDDHTRRGEHVYTWRDGAEFVRAYARRFRADPWADADARVQVWVESRGVAATVAEVCKRYAVSLYPCNGQPSDSFLWAEAKWMGDHEADCERPIEVLYVGDYDKAGFEIESAVEFKLSEMLAIHDFFPDVNLTRVAVTADQAQRLPAHPGKGTKRWAREVQAAAIPKSELQALLEAAVREHLPTGALQRASAVEARERAMLASFRRPDTNPETHT